MRLNKFQLRSISVVTVFALALSWVAQGATPARALQQPVLERGSSTAPVVRIAPATSTSQTVLVDVSFAAPQCTVSSNILSPVNVQGTSGLNLYQPASCFRLSLGTSYYSHFSVAPLAPTHNEAVSVAVARTPAAVALPHQLQQDPFVVNSAIIPFAVNTPNRLSGISTNFISDTFATPRPRVLPKLALAMLQVFRC